MRMIAIATCTALVAGAALLYGGQNEPKADKAALQQQLLESLKARAESAQRAYDTMRNAFDSEEVTLDTLEDAIKNLAEAELALATTQVETIAALQRNVERTKLVEAKIKPLYDLGTRGGEAKEYFSAKRDRETAEILLLNTRIKATQ